MVVVRDNIGRPIYRLNSEGRFHPFENERVADDFEYNYPDATQELSKFINKYAPYFIAFLLGMLAVGLSRL